MLKIIFKNLWNRRRQNGWLFAELIIVTILTWVVIDPTIVGISDLNSPLGYDADRLVKITVECLPDGAENFDQDRCDPESRENDYRAVRLKAAALPDVEKCIVEVQGINDFGYMSGGHSTGNAAVDSVVKSSFTVRYLRNEPILSTYGIRAAEGSPSIEELEAMPLGENDLIITESLDRAYWPDRRGVKDKYFISWNHSGDTIHTKIAGIVKDFRHRSFIRTSAVCLRPTDLGSNRFYNSMRLTLRLRDGVDAQTYVRDNLPLISSELGIGNYYVKSVTSQRDMIASIEDMENISNQRNLYFFIAALFLINLIVGVTGCVWLQTGKRVSELGVMRSYGATRQGIIALLTGESIVLATVAFVIGDLLFLQYALMDGLYIGAGQSEDFILTENWVSSFWQHFAIVSAIVYIIIISCSIAGTYFPARHAADINPVDALRDE